MVWSKRFLQTLESPTEQRFSSHVVALIAEHRREVAHARKRVRMVGTKRFLAAFESPAVQRFRRSVVLLIAEHRG